MTNKINTGEKIKWEAFLVEEYRKKKLWTSFGMPCYNYYKIFGLYKYDPKISHWKNFCNRLKWPLSHKKLENVTLSPGKKFWICCVVYFGWAYALWGGPKYPAFWIWLFLIIPLLLLWPILNLIF